MRTIQAIQYLRALAALAVVAFHAAEKTGHHFVIGAAGVDVFFVISGFIMWVISARRPVTPVKFLADRARRILPIYWLATAVMVAGGLVGLFPNLVLTAEHVVASLLFVPARAPSTGEIWPVLVQGWTLNYEMFFYAVFAASLVLPRFWRLPAVAGFFLVLVVAGLSLTGENPLLLTYTRPLVLEFVAGMLIGAFWLDGRLPPLAAGVGLVVTSFGGFALIAGLRLPFDERLTGPLSVLLVLGALSFEAHGRVPTIRILNLLGNASYSIYLWHTFAISVVAKAGTLFGLHSKISMLIATVAGTLVGIVGYLLLERPLLQRDRTPPPAPGLAGGTAE
ncbi:acyltransferase [Ensifer sp. LCM 4579]|uniref:acyltransferase family protein n=1 Tax=Ensifer sp. LCM 4579 TaxID=1848292 RepID=UPI0008D9F5F4|nr:acyltransferase [Ensifer sp. LCM 4579]OHV78762.1 exopolysaccharide biosynthesis protein [Ensifer sp. LCM 4579]